MADFQVRCRPGRLFRCALVAVGIGCAGLSGAQEISVPAHLNQQVVERIASRIESDGPQWVLVMLDPGSFSNNRHSPGVVEQYRQAIRQSQDSLMAYFQRGQVVEKIRYTEFPISLLEVDSTGLSELMTAPGITAVVEDTLDDPGMLSSNPVIGSPAAWSAGFDGSGWTVAVLDTGVDKTHPWFSTFSKVVSEACYSTTQPPSAQSVCPPGLGATDPGSGVNCPFPIVNCDHGTHVAGTAVGNDGVGAAGYGVARGATLIAIQVFSNINGVAQSYRHDQISGLERVLQLKDTYNIAAVNMSLGGGSHSTQASCDADNPARKLAIDNLRDVGIATVISAGNSGSTTSMGAPGCISSAIGIGATTDSDDIASFSNIASFPDGGGISLLAPGQSITSSVPGGGTGTKQGTSMAAPHVTGAWAIINQDRGGASADTVLAALQANATLVDDERPGGVVTGMHRINVDLSLSNGVEFDSTPPGGSTIAFGDVHITVQSADSILTLRNLGTSTMTLGCSLSGANPASFSHTACPASISGSGSVDITLNCTPPVIGAQAASLDVTTDDPDESNVSYNLTCNGISPEFGSVPAPNSTLDFGDVAVGVITPPELSVLVDNSGTTDLTLSCELSGAAADSYNITDCPSSIGPTLASNVTVNCDPVAAGSQAASLDITTNDADEATVSYSLACSGQGPEFESSPAEGFDFDFGDVSVGDSSSSLSVQVSNAGNLDLNWTTCEKVGADPADFEITVCPAPLAISPAGMDTAEFRCTPQSEGVKTAILRLTTDDFDEGTVDYGLTCNGTIPVFDPDPVNGTDQDFGDVEILTTSAARIIEITNSGSEDLVFTTCELSGTDVGEYGLSGCPASIAPAASAQISLTCEPLTTGAKSASLDIATNDATAGPAAYALLCNAVLPDEFFSDDFEGGL